MEISHQLMKAFNVRTSDSCLASLQSKLEWRTKDVEGQSSLGKYITKQHLYGGIGVLSRTDWENTSAWGHSVCGHMASWAIHVDYQTWIDLEVCKCWQPGRVRLFVTPWTIAQQAALSMGFSRQGYWNGLPFPSPGDSPYPGIESMSPASPALRVEFL